MRYKAVFTNVFSALYLSSVCEIQGSLHQCVFSIIPQLSLWDTRQSSPMCFQHYTSAQSVRYKAVFTNVFSALYLSSVCEIQGSLHQCVFSIIPQLSLWDTRQSSPMCFQHYTSAQSVRYKAVFTNWNCVFSIIPLPSPWDTRQSSPIGTYTSAQSVRYKAVFTNWNCAFWALYFFSVLYRYSVLEIQDSLHQLELCFHHYSFLYFCPVPEIQGSHHQVVELCFQPSAYTQFLCQYARKSSPTETMLSVSCLHWIMPFTRSRAKFGLDGCQAKAVCKWRNWSETFTSSVPSELKEVRIVVTWQPVTLLGPIVPRLSKGCVSFILHKGSSLLRAFHQWPSLDTGHWQLLAHTPSIAFRHLPPNSARFSYATEGVLFISMRLSANAVSGLRKVSVLVRL